MKRRQTPKNEGEGTTPIENQPRKSQQELYALYSEKYQRYLKKKELKKKLKEARFSNDENWLD
eukprot:CAMPEP_0202967288 /NCGR_PEP_ID=MMETSP1396-20130829/12096_1 /ASSEMBLY_ACC=CAM_ASM_000872 /TAXON_ID= /ORGANISM="Pseudokeronopsis sp., Strain Brazil" /LENGTH=62 /DNA_ID=CAMNT_0049692161 /DNA_START=133 /DNA_END=321 /DNA_ORIENTATION=-